MKGVEDTFPIMVSFNPSTHTGMVIYFFFHQGFTKMSVLWMETATNDRSQRSSLLDNMGA